MKDTKGLTLVYDIIYPSSVCENNDLALRIKNTPFEDDSIFDEIPKRPAARTQIFLTKDKTKLLQRFIAVTETEKVSVMDLFPILAEEVLQERKDNFFFLTPKKEDLAFIEQIKEAEQEEYLMIGE